MEKFHSLMYDILIYSSNYNMTDVRESDGIVHYNSRRWDILLVEVVLKLCDCFFGGLGLLYKKSLIFWTKMSICCFLQEKIRLHRTLLNLYKELLHARKKPIYCKSKYRGYTICMYIHVYCTYKPCFAPVQCSGCPGY